MIGRRIKALGLAGVVALMSAVFLSSCQPVDRNPPPEVNGGDPAAGANDISHSGCGGCHVIPGIDGADGTVGPPLTDFGHRGFIAGQLANKPSNLMLWLQDPKEVEPGTDMPDLGLDAAQARDIAAYLYTLD
jgi:cytochrome c